MKRYGKGKFFCIKRTLNILLLLITVSCSKDSNHFDPLIHAHIQSPYLEEVLINMGIDSDGAINERTLKKDIEGIEQLDIILNMFQDENNECNPRFNFDFKNNLIEGLSEFKNLKKLVLVIRPEPDDELKRFKHNHLYNENCTWDGDKLFNASVSGLERLEEIYVGGRDTDFGNKLDFKITNCPELSKIGAANPFVGLTDYPDGSIISFDKSSFFSPRPSYSEFDNLFEGDEVGGGPTEYSSNLFISFDLINLPKLETLHLHHMGIIEIAQSNSAVIKELFLRKRRYEFTPDFYLFSELALRSVEELYVDYNFFDSFPDGEGKVLNLSNFPELSQVFYRYYAPGFYRNTIASGSKLLLNNGKNLENDMRINVGFDYASGLVSFEDMKAFEICLDEDITEDFLNKNIQIIWENGLTGNEAITLSCD